VFPKRDDGFVDPIVLDRRFRVWSYGVGHSQLLLHARADAAHLEYLNVLFEDVRAVKLPSSYQPLILALARSPVRSDILAFAHMPVRHRHRYLSLTLSAEPEDGFVLCARATVLAVDKTSHQNPIRASWPDAALQARLAERGVVEIQLPHPSPAQIDLHQPCYLTADPSSRTSECR
jgi:hypothetical protein